MQFEKLGAGKQGGIHLKVGILRGRPDQNDGALLHMRQEIILLGLVKAMNLVYKQDSFSAVAPHVFLGSCHRLFHVLLSGGSGIDGDKIRLAAVGNYLRQRSLSRSGRPEEKKRMKLV